MPRDIVFPYCHSSKIIWRFFLANSTPMKKMIFTCQSTPSLTYDFSHVKESESLALKLVIYMIPCSRSQFGNSLFAIIWYIHVSSRLSSFCVCSDAFPTLCVSKLVREFMHVHSFSALRLIERSGLCKDRNLLLLIRLSSKESSISTLNLQDICSYQPCFSSSAVWGFSPWLNWKVLLLSLLLLNSILWPLSRGASCLFPAFLSMFSAGVSVLK